MLGGGKRNFWPGTSFSGLADLNRRVREWLDTVANVRIHGTTHERPMERLAAERKYLHPLPKQERVQVFLREERKVSRDGYVAWDGARYGVHWSHAGRVVHVQASGSLVEVWSGDERLAMHPRATRHGQKSNKGFAEWGEVLGDSVVATAILDRLLRHSHVINIRGESYRLREKKRAGLLTTALPAKEVTSAEQQKT